MDLQDWLTSIQVNCFFRVVIFLLNMFCMLTTGYECYQFHGFPADNSKDKEEEESTRKEQELKN